MVALRAFACLAVVLNFGLAFGVDAIKTPAQIAAERNMAEAQRNYSREREIAIGQMEQARRHLATVQEKETTARSNLRTAQAGQQSGWNRLLNAMQTSDGQNAGYATAAETVSAAQIALNQAHETSNAANRRLTEANTRIRNIENASRLAVAVNRDTVESEQGKIRTLEDQIRRLDDFRDFSETRLEISDARVRLQALEKVLDQAAVGEYMRTKFSALLSSNVLCEAAKACGENKKPNISRDKVDKEIFPVPGARPAAASSGAGRNTNR